MTTDLEVNNMPFIRIENMDCLIGMQSISDNSVDLVILDLPYGQTACKWDIPINLNDLWVQLKRVGKINTAYVFFTTTKFGYELIKSNEKWFRYDLVWNKQKNVGFLNARKMPMRCHEMIYVFYNKLPTYNLNDNHIHTPPHDKQSKYNGDVYGDGGGTLTQVHGSQWNPRLPSSILDFKTEKNRCKQFHQTEKPIDVLQWIIKYYSKEGDTVLDPTVGSGSTAVACKLLKRNCIGFEMDVTIFNVLKNRLEIE